MASKAQSTERMEALQTLTDRLLSPDLTLCEARDLRGRVMALIGVDLEVVAANLPCDCRRSDPRSPGCRHFAA